MTNPSCNNPRHKFKMKCMNYTQAYSKIIDAYFRDEIRPNNCEFCFCGTLCGDNKWHSNPEYVGEYSPRELKKMERALFLPFPETDWRYNMPSFMGHTEKTIPNYEDKLFAGMSAALDVLKQIHIDRGEIIDPLPQFTRRVPSLTNKTS